MPPDPEPDPNIAVTDDLLAQLAGDEIDRLLADSDAPRSTGAPAAVAAETPPVAKVASSISPAVATPADLDTETAKQLDSLFADLTNSAPEPAAPAEPKQVPPAAVQPAPPAAQEQAVASELDHLFNELTASDGKAPLPAEPAPAITPPPAAPAANVPPIAQPAPLAQAAQSPEAPKEPALAASVDPADQTGALERQVLAAEIMPDDEPAAEDRPAPQDRVPLLVRLLDLLNLPFANLSASVRDMAGKVAIATLVNALLVLSYVLFVRHS